MGKNEEQGGKSPKNEPPKGQREQQGAQVTGVGRRGHEDGRRGMNRAPDSGRTGRR